MSFVSHWPRWIHASIAKYFETVITTDGGYKFFVEGEWQQEDLEVQTGAELRIDGPYLSQQPNDKWIAYVEINILVSVFQDRTNTHLIHEIIGVIVEGFSANIPIYRYGDESVDTDTLVACAVRFERDRRHGIVTSHFGRVEPQTPLIQATVEAHFVTELDGV